MTVDPEHPSDNQADGENRKAEKAKRKGVTTKANVRRVIFWEGIGLQLLALIAVVSLIGHNYLFVGCALSLIYFAISSYVSYRRFLHNSETKKKATRKSVIILVCGVAPVAVILMLLQPSKFTGGLDITIDQPGARGLPTLLTNAYALFSLPSKPDALDEDIKSCLVIPVVPGATNSELNFGLHNGAPFPVQFPVLCVTVRSNLECRFDEEWGTNIAVPYGFKSFVIQSQITIPSSEFRSCPSVEFKVFKSPAKRIRIMSKGQGVEAVTLDAWMMFLETTNEPLPKPFVVPIEFINGKMHLEGRLVKESRPDGTVWVGQEWHGQ